MPGTPVLVRYADDFLVLCHSRRAGRGGQGPAGGSGWRPGVFASTRTRPRIVPLTQGFDFLGFNIRRYPSGKLLIKPSKAAIKRIR